jgi:insertion element IS1 protein InsB
VDHATNTELAYTFGRHQDQVVKPLKALLKPFGIRRYYTDDWRTYTRYLDAEQYTVGQQNTQKSSYCP